MQYSACIEWLFAAEAPNFADRIRLAKAAGLEAVEFWHWRNKDIEAIATALAETKMSLSGMIAEPMIALTDPANHDVFVTGLVESVQVARRLGAGVLIAQAGDDLFGHSRRDQHAAIVACLKRAADVLAGTGVVLALEPLNTLIDHKGYFLDSTREGLDIVDEVGRPEIRLLYDIYHSLVMREDVAKVLAGRVDRIAHVHIADHPGRNQPGTGFLDLRDAVDWLVEQGYRGRLGLEYRPTRESAATVAETRLALEG